MRNNSPSLFELYPPIIGSRLSVVCDALGRTSGTTGTSNDITNSADRKLLLHLRSLADVIVTSGATARAESLRASRFAPMCILTKSAEVAAYEQMLSDKDKKEVFFLTPTANSHLLQAALKQAGFKNAVYQTDDLRQSSVLEGLKSLGYSRLLAEFGPSLSALWLAERLIDEVCLTVTDVVPDQAFQLPYYLAGLKLGEVSRHFDLDSNTLFLRFRVLTQQAS